VNLQKRLVTALAFVLSIASFSTAAFADQVPAQDAVTTLDHMSEVSQVDSPDELFQSEALPSEEMNVPNRWVRRPPRYRDHVCYARNGRGEWFSGRARDRNTAARRAIESCARYSRNCRLMSCHVN
jgi:hypothetical protein